jgi:hypothetical protein
LVEEQAGRSQRAGTEQGARAGPGSSCVPEDRPNAGGTEISGLNGRHSPGIGVLLRLDEGVGHGALSMTNAAPVAVG